MLVFVGGKGGGLGIFPESGLVGLFSGARKSLGFSLSGILTFGCQFFIESEKESELEGGIRGAGLKLGILGAVGMVGLFCGATKSAGFRESGRITLGFHLPMESEKES